MYSKVQPTGIERPWPEEGIIVTKTDLKGIITYVNDVFLEMAILTEKEAIGKPHNIIRHPDMPRCVFKLMWDTLEQGKEVLAYVKNMATNGDHYWTFASITQILDSTGKPIGYQAPRLRMRPSQIEKIEPYYQKLLAEEQKYESPKDGMAASSAMLEAILADKKLTYKQFVFLIT